MAKARGLMVMADLGQQFAAGYTTFCMKPSQHTDNVDEVRSVCDRVVAHLATISSDAQ